MTCSAVIEGCGGFWCCLLDVAKRLATEPAALRTSVCLSVCPPILGRLEKFRVQPKCPNSFMFICIFGQRHANEWAIAGCWISFASRQKSEWDGEREREGVCEAMWKGYTCLKSLPAMWPATTYGLPFGFSFAISRALCLYAPILRALPWAPNAHSPFRSRLPLMKLMYIFMAYGYGEVKGLLGFLWLCYEVC